MFRIITFLLLASALFQVIPAEETENKNYDYHLVKINKLKDTDKLVTFDYNYTKINETTLNIQLTLEQLVELNDEWQIEYVIYYNADGTEKFEEPIFTLPYQGICQYMKTVYKQYVYDMVKDHSNFPHYDTCPLPATKYEVKDFPFNFGTYSVFGSPGMWRIDTLFQHKDQPAGGSEVFFTVKEKP